MSGITVADGMLVRMRKGTETVEVSLCSVGHRLAEGYQAIDNREKPIEPKQMWTKRNAASSAQVTMQVAIDPGPQYDCCFLVDAPSHDAMRYKGVQKIQQQAA